MDRWIEFIGHFHPVFVHLPIGILMITALLMSLSAYQKIQLGQDLLKILLIAGAMSAVLSCITGFMLSQSGDYDAATLNLHQWMGISVAILSVVSYFIVQNNADKVVLLSASIGFVVFVSITGHLGGSLTHGSDYLAIPAPVPPEENLSTINLDSAAFYNDLVKPILKRKCYSCHGPEKQKGKLRLDEKEYIVKGGKHGEVIAEGKPNDSELIARVELDISNKEHMPPKEKPQLTNQETEVIKLWIESGADFEKPVTGASNFQKVKTIIQSDTEILKSSDVPEEEINRASDAEINKLTESGITVTPVASESPYLSVSLISIPGHANKLISSLTKIKDNIVWLKLSGTNADDSSISQLSTFSNLTKLHLDDTKITDKALESISSLKNLQYLNLKGTTVSLMGLGQLKDLKKLKTLFVYQTKVTEKEEGRIRELFPHTEINFGNYSVPTLESDTSIVKVK